MRLYGLYYAWIGVSKRRKIIINSGATAIYRPKGASGPSSYVIILGTIKNKRANTIFAPTITVLKSIYLQNR